MLSGCQTLSKMKKVFFLLHFVFLFAAYARGQEGNGSDGNTPIILPDEKEDDNGGNCRCNIIRGIKAGPLSIVFLQPAAPGPLGDDGICRYEVPSARVDLNLLGAIQRSAKIPDLAKVSFGKDCR